MKTISLALAKQLKEAGYLQGSKLGYYLIWRGMHEYFAVLSDDSSKRIVDAPTADEILEKLPAYFLFKNKPVHLLIEREYFDGIFKWSVAYASLSYKKKSKFWELDISLAEAAGRIWFSLKENNLL